MNVSADVPSKTCPIQHDALPGALPGALHRVLSRSAGRVRLRGVCRARRSVRDRGWRWAICGLTLLFVLSVGGGFFAGEALAARAEVPPGEPVGGVQRPLVADLSKHLVAITTGFDGTDVLMFGATNGPGDVVLVVRGPTHREVVRRMDKVAGLIWANKSSVSFENAPSFLLVASSRPVEDILPLSVQQRHQMTPQTLSLVSRGLEDGETLQHYRDALFRLKEKQSLYRYQPTSVSLLANRLFRADLFFPATVPTGVYSAEVYLVRNGEVVSAEITPLVISKVGVGADVYHFAHEQSALYGLAAILVAVAAGWLAGLAFRKG